MVNAIEYVHIPEFDAYETLVAQALPGPMLADFAGIRVAVSENGACALNGRSARTRYAHAHNYTGDHQYGLICTRASRVRNADGSLGSTMWHELAHLLAPNTGHTAAWRGMMTSLGQPLGSYAPKPRRKPIHFYRVYVWDRTTKRGVGDELISSTAPYIQAFCAANSVGRFYVYAEREWGLTEHERWRACGSLERVYKTLLDEWRSVA